MPSFVQFIHPGGEHGRDAVGRKGWNVADHRHKFMRVEGQHVERPGAKPVGGEVVLWGEWEPESEVAAIVKRLPGGPRGLHRPYYVRPGAFRWGEQGLQNTDPFVFGDRFLYTLCRQWRGSSGRPTVLRDLASGSLILFGSLKGGAFVLDTALVTDAGVLHDSRTWPSVLASRVFERWDHDEGLPRRHRRGTGPRVEHQPPVVVRGNESAAGQARGATRDARTRLREGCQIDMVVGDSADIGVPA